MCLYPRKYTNKKYTVTEKNGGVVPTPPLLGGSIYESKIGNTVIVHDDREFDNRVLEIEIPCGRCIECMKKKAREWTTRLLNELPEWQYKYMITLTFTNDAFREIMKETNSNNDPVIAKYAMRHMLERWRKDHKKSLKHWFITELGHENTERIHMHGIVFTNEPLEFTDKEPCGNGYYWYKWKYWKYGRVHVGDYCNERTINYITKYMTKIDKDHKQFVGEVLCSPGIGKAFLKTEFAKQYKYIPGYTKTHYTLPNGQKSGLPTYYRNHIFNEEEREQIWRDQMDKEQITLVGIKLSKIDHDPEDIESVWEKAKEENIKAGYGDNSKTWKKKDYCITSRMLRASQARQEMFEKYKKIADQNDETFKKIQKMMEEFGELK